MNSTHLDDAVLLLLLLLLLLLPTLQQDKLDKGKGQTRAERTASQQQAPGR